MKMFTFKPELPRTIEELNQFDRREIDDIEIYETTLSFLYAIILVIAFCMACSYVAEKLNTFENQIQKSFIV